MNERKDFKPWAVALVYDQQEGLCAKCGKPLGKLFHRHHKDGNHANNTVDNLELYCASCHGGEAFKTYINQKKQIMGDVEALIAKGIGGELSGAVTDKLLDAIKLQLGLINEVYDPELERVPLEVRTQRYLESSGMLLKAEEEGIRKGLERGIELAKDIVLKYLLAQRMMEED